MNVLPVPCLADNYAYVLFQDGSRKAIVVDPSEANPVLEALDRKGLELGAILCTHHHPDHVGGNETLTHRYPGIEVFAHISDAGRVPGQTQKVEEGGTFELLGREVRPLHVPGHTRGAVTYVIEGSAFTGDTLFVAGCGRLFEGTAAEMFASLSKIARLPPETRLYVGHEYTASNLRFAAHVEPENAAIAKRLSWATETRARGEATVPSSVEQELVTNPFLRTTAEAVRAKVGGESAVEVFANLRRAKDNFR